MRTTDHVTYTAAEQAFLRARAAIRALPEAAPASPATPTEPEHRAQRDYVRASLLALPGIEIELPRNGQGAP